MNIVWLGEAACADPALVGGKAANLSRLAQRCRIPPGFCLTVHALEQAQGLDLEHPVLSLEGLPAGVRRALVDAYGQLQSRCGSARPQLAVRSSAVDEDGSQASFAGQHATYLNVIGEQALAAAVVRCWASAFSETAMAYRRIQGFEARRIQIGVLVQQLVPADTSLVLFSANPLNADPNEMMINANWGLGESVVGGSVTPDAYLIDKASGRVKQRTIGDKERMTILGPQGTQEVPVPRLLRQRACLDAAQLEELARLGTSLEAQMGWPVDLECAFHQGVLYVLQCRPITTLSRKERPR